MPAAEQTSRDTKLLHKIFGATSFVMLVATIWMFASDHAREWKPIQRTSDNIEIKMTNWRELQYQTEDATRQRSELAGQVAAARRKPIPGQLLDEFEAEVHRVPETQNVSFAKIRELASSIEANASAGGDQDPNTAIDEDRQEEIEEDRDELLEELRQIVRKARHREDTLLSRRKFKSADRDAAVATHGIMVRDNRPLEEQNGQQREIDGITAELNELTVNYQAAKEHRAKLDRIIKEITAEEVAAREALTKSEADLNQLREAKDQRSSTYFNWVGWVPLPGKKFLELPILDAFNSPRKIDNLWSNGLEIDYNFSKVRRFDRCTTCHQAMQKTAPGSAIEPAYDGETLLDFQLVVATNEEEAAAPAGDGTAPPAAAPAEPQSAAVELENNLGLRIAEAGLINRNDATVQFIRPETPAAAARTVLNPEATKVTGDDLRKSLLTAQGHGPHGQLKPGLQVGDVIVAVNGDPVTEPWKVTTRLLDEIREGKDFTVTVRRGLPNPYTSHPRLDLFVGSLSPHKMSDFACTICHEGQGSATAFKFASHTPNTEQQRKNWVFDHGWFNNLHWIFPMYPDRFAESACLKCHHTVTELESSPKFPETTAPKVVRGYHLIRKYGCYGCHEINGYDGPRRIGPDLRLEPNVFAAALQLQSDPGFEKLSEEEKDWVQQLIDHPDRDAVRYRVLEMLEIDATAETPRLSQATYDKLTPLFRDIESPGELRKAGPSLRYAAAKLDGAFLYDWIREPKHFRPSTRMPQFFGLTEHLQGSEGLHDAIKLEPIEILGLSTFLQARSQPFEYLAPAEGAEAANVERGKIAFQTRGCLACHTHKEFADADSYRAADEIVQGPDLSNIGDKFVGENQRKWLYSWIRQPSRYHARTVMPDLFLDPIRTKDGENEVVTDPVADIVEFLLTASKAGWKPKPDTLIKPTDADAKELDRFVRLNLVDTYSEARADTYMNKGIPESMRRELKGAEVELLVPDDQHQAKDFQLTPEQKLMYIGSKTISKYGCYGCHDIPGFEDAKPIGTVLADWGRKDPAKLAFEHITHYIEHGHGTNSHGGHGHADDHGQHANGSGEHKSADAAATDNAGGSAADSKPAGTGADLHAGVPPHPDESAADREYYVSLLKGGNRAGFLWQKLLEPRSYDYHKTENKKYSERLRMPQFPFDAEEREAIVTFVLGLIADPPNEKYVFQPSERTKAILAGREVLEKYNCGGCHVLSPEKWNVMFQPGWFGEQSPVKLYPYLRTHFTPQELKDSAKTDRAGLVRTELEGMPAVDDSGLPIAYDDAGDPLEADGEYEPTKVEYSFELWKPAAVEGNPFEVGVLPVNVPANLIQKRRGTDGGFLAKYLLPHVVALEKQVNPAAKGTEAWGWLPPPLSHEGQKVQTDWLHSFLLNPYAIRPATFLRMPRFNMTPLEATKLVNYFAAMDDAEYPYSFSSRRQSEHLRRAEETYQQGREAPAEGAEPRSRLDDAMRIVVNNNYCVKCHLVGDFEPTGSDRAKAPNLSQVYRRLRPDYLRSWIANPKSYLPYTSMPVNIPYDPDLPNMGGVAQDLFHGTSVEQVDGLVDLLMNFDEYARQQSSVETLVKEFGGAPAPADGAPGANPPPAATPPAADAAADASQ